MEQRDDRTDGASAPDDYPPLYRVYVLRLWSSGTRAAWEGGVRCSLEDPTTRTRRGFADLDSLMRFVREDFKSPQEVSMNTIKGRHGEAIRPPRSRGGASVDREKTQ